MVEVVGHPKFCKFTGYNIECIFLFRERTLCYISPSRALQMSLAFNVYFFVYLESVAGFKFGFKFGKCCGFKFGLELNLN